MAVRLWGRCPPPYYCLPEREGEEMKLFDRVVTIVDLTSLEGVHIPKGTVADIVEVYTNPHGFSIGTDDGEIIDCSPQTDLYAVPVSIS